jgi:hypothetical protein
MGDFSLAQMGWLAVSAGVFLPSSSGLDGEHKVGPELLERRGSGLVDLASETSELLQQRVVLGARLGTFQPLHITLKPHAASLLGTLSGQILLPLSRSFVAVLCAAELSKLTASIGVGDGLKSIFEGLSSLLDEDVGLAREDFFDHLKDGLLFVQVSSFPHVTPKGSVRSPCSCYRTENFGLRVRELPDGVWSTYRE